MYSTFTGIRACDTGLQAQALTALLGLVFGGTGWARGHGRATQAFQVVVTACPCSARPPDSVGPRQRVGCAC